MSHRSPLWPAQLDHIRLDSDDAASLAAFYCDTLGFADVAQPDGSHLLQAPARRIVIGPGAGGTQPYSAFRLGGTAQLAALRDHLAGRGIAVLPSPSPVFAEDAFAVRDPDGRLAAVGLARRDLPHTPVAPAAAPRLPVRLQHLVVAAARLPELMGVDDDVLG